MRDISCKQQHLLYEVMSPVPGALVERLEDTLAWRVLKGCHLLSGKVTTLRAPALLLLPFPRSMRSRSRGK